MNRNYGPSNHCVHYTYSAEYILLAPRKTYQPFHHTYYGQFLGIQQAKKTIQPVSTLNQSCTFMFMLNLADAEWLLVNCHTKFTPDIVCSKETKAAENSSTASENRLKRKICSSKAIKKGKLCYFFLWFTLKENKELKFSANMFPSNLKLMDLEQHTLKSFDFLLGASSHTTFTVLAFHAENKMMMKHTYKRVWFKVFEEVHLSSVVEAEGFEIFTAPVKTALAQGGNVFKCTNNKLISSLYVLDGTKDCFEESSISISIDETCVLKTESCPLKCLSLICKCSSLHFQAIDGQCKSYTTPLERYRPDSTYIKSEYFQCSEVHYVDHSLVDDLVPDCGLTAKDEPMYRNVLENFASFQCDKPDKIPCKLGHKKCYSMTDICFYQLGKFNNLIACRIGSHLERCSDFECNIAFKCSKSYCIPWSYVCDEKWDCPHGHDEHHTHNCGTERMCPELFSCRKSQLCVHTENVCDGTVDCPEHDDEVMCELKNHICPFQCSCLNVAVSCVQITVHVELLLMVPFQSYHLIEINLYSMNFIKDFFLVKNVNISRNKLKDVCTKFNNNPSVQVLDFSANYVRSLWTHCFTNISHLHRIVAQNNGLVLVEIGTFFNLSRVDLIDLSQNNLLCITHLTFINVMEIKILNISLNSLLTIDSRAFEGTYFSKIVTSFAPVCCVKPLNASCTILQMNNNNHLSCSRLLISQVQRIILPVLCFPLILLNCFCLFVHFRSDVENKRLVSMNKSKEASGMYETIVMIVNSACVLFGIYLNLMWAVDLHLKEDFILQQYLWSSSEICFLGSLLQLWCLLTLPMCLFLLGLGRLMITLYPLTSKFKVRSKTKKYVLLCLTAISISAAASVTYLKITDRRLSKICSLFVRYSGFLFEAIISTVSLATAHIFVTISIIIVYTLLIWSLDHQQSRVAHSNNKSRKVLQRSILINLPSIVCWLTSDALHISFLFFVETNTDVLLWATTTIMAVTCLFYPIFFLATWKV